MTRDKPDLMSLCEFSSEGGIYFPHSETLIIADLHLGWTPSMTKDNTLFPEDVIQTVIDRLEALIKNFSPNRVVFAGDIVQRRTAEKPLVKESLNEIYSLLENTESIFLAGNHDPNVLPPDKKLKRFTNVEGITVFHGKEPIQTVNTRYVCAHLHPIVSETDNTQCFIIARRDTTFQVLILPSLNPYLNCLPVNKIRWNRVPLSTENIEQKIIPIDTV